MMYNDENDLIILLNYTWYLNDKTINIPVVAGEPQASHCNCMSPVVTIAQYQSQMSFT